METVDDSILTALGTRQDRSFLLLLEEEFKHFVKVAQMDECIVFPTMTSYYRLLIHKVAEKYGLRSESSGWGSERATTVGKTAASEIPCLSFRDLIIHDTAGYTEPNKKIKLNSSAPSAVTPNLSSTSPISTEPSSNLTSTASVNPNTTTPPSSTPSSEIPSTTESTTNNTVTSTPTTNPPTNTSEPITNNPPTTSTSETVPKAIRGRGASRVGLRSQSDLEEKDGNKQVTEVKDKPEAKPETTPAKSESKTEPSKPAQSSGGRVVRGRGASKFMSRSHFSDSESESEPEESEKTEKEAESTNDPPRELQDGVEKGLYYDNFGDTEDTPPPPKEIPLRNDFSKFEYGAKNSRGNNEAYGVASYEHIAYITTINSDKDEIEKLLSPTKQRYTLKEGKKNNFYVIFRSVTAAQNFVDEMTAKYPPATSEYEFQVLLSTSTPKKEDFSDEAIYPRPATTARVARRLIGNALEMINLQVSQTKQ